MNIEINGLTINGTHVEMVDFVELWQTRSVSLAAFGAKLTDVQRWKCDPINDTIIEARMTAPDTIKPLSAVASKHNDVSPGSIVRGAVHIPMTPEVVAHIDNVTKRYAPVPKVKHTDVPPADAPIVKVPAGASGKKPRGPSNNAGISSRIRLAIFNGQTRQQSLERALGCGQQIASARIASLIKLGHVEEVKQAEYIPGKRVFRLTEHGIGFIEADKAKLKELGILP